MEINNVLQNSFERWLNTIGYAESTVYASTNYVRDFFTWLDKTPVKELSQINNQVVKTYHDYLQTRRNKTKSGSLSNNYIISNINALKRFSKYLQVTGKATLEIDLQLQAIATETKTILTRAEVKALYKACDNDILGIRDRAILSIYYGCGLRRSEGINLNVNDILLKEKRVYVRKGKNYKERYVPMSEAVKEDLENYIYYARERILSFKNIKNAVSDDWRKALFLSMQVKRMHGNSLINRLHHLLNKTKIEKETGLHTLRHSIATHLLQSGMELEEVSQFLGHVSLESTQIYTHLI
jgi:integrase/recombinase XerD